MASVWVRYNNTNYGNGTTLHYTGGSATVSTDDPLPSASNVCAVITVESTGGLGKYYYNFSRDGSVPGVVNTVMSQQGYTWKGTFNTLSNPSVDAMISSITSTCTMTVKAGFVETYSRYWYVDCTSTITVTYPSVTKASWGSITQGSDGKVTFTWNAATGSNGSGSVTYRVACGSTYLCSAQTGTSLTLSNTSLISSGITAGAAHKYKVYAYYTNSMATSTSDESSNFTFQDVTITISSFAASQADTSRDVDLSWTFSVSYGTGDPVCSLYAVSGGTETVIASNVTSPYLDTRPDYTSSRTYRLKVVFSGKTGTNDVSISASYPTVKTYPRFDTDKHSGREFILTAEDMGQYRYAAGLTVTYECYISKGVDDITAATKLSVDVTSQAIPSGSYSPPDTAVVFNISKAIVDSFGPSHNDKLYLWLKPNIANMTSNPSSEEVTYRKSTIMYCDDDGVSMTECEIYYCNDSQTFVPVEVHYCQDGENFELMS